jgi:acylphosphatase
MEHIDRLQVLLTSALLILFLGTAVGQGQDVPSPKISEITQLKAPHLSTPLVEDGRPAAAIVAPASGRYEEIARQLQDAIRRVTGVRVPVIDETSPEAEFTEPPRYVGGRHQQYSALTMYVLARYFNEHYSDPVWKQALEASENRFKALHETAWLDGIEGENSWWYSTYYAPAIAYMLLSGDRHPMAVGTMPKIFRGQEILTTGRSPGFALYYASVKQLNQTAHLTNEGQWLRYRQRLGLQTDMFRLGQSFWPDTLEPAAPTPLVDQWSVNPLARRFWEREIDYFPYEQGFLWASYRNRPDDSGDFILLDGHDGKNRNPHHAFAILELRIGGQDILRARSQGRQATLNQVRTFADGMVNPKVKTSAVLRDTNVVGETVTVTGEVKELGFSDWRRTIAQRLGRYALVVDDVTFARNTKNMQIQTIWQGQAVWWNEAQQALELPDRASTTKEPPVGQIRMSDALSIQVEEETARAVWRGSVEKGERRFSFL